MPKLEDWRMELFCREFVRDLNAGRAAVRAGYPTDSGEKYTACSRGSRLRALPEVEKRIEELLERRLHKLDLDADAVVELVRRASMWDIADYYRRNEAKELELIPPDELTEAAAASVVGLKYDRQHRPFYELCDKTANRTLLMRHMGLLNDKVDVTSGGKPINLSDDERAARIAEILEAARTRRTGPAPSAD